MLIDILGAGIVGLACADELIARGHRVRVIDPAPGTGASYAAAGMLSPSGEAWFGEEELLRLGVASAALWPAYAERLGVPLAATGTLLVGADAGDLQQVERHAGLLAERGMTAEPLSRRQVREREPSLGRVAGGVLLPEDHSVDPRQVVAALLRRVQVHAEADQDARPDATVLATGARLPEPHRHLVRPVRGEILRLRTDDPPARTIRAVVHGEPVYLVPRPADGATAELVVGATAEEHDDPAVVTAGGVARLLEAARRLSPGIDRAELVEATARDRPGTRDNLPLVGPSGVDGVLLAAGHYRHGVLLAPLTARLIADHFDHGHVETALDPRRFPPPTERSTP